MPELPGTVDSGELPITMHWDCNALSNRGTAAGHPDIAVVIPKKGVVAGICVQAINTYAPYPNAFKLWDEFHYSGERQIIWFKGYGHPVRFDDLSKRAVVHVTVRPEMIRIVAENGIALTGSTGSLTPVVDPNRLRGTLDNVLFLGAVVRMIVQVGRQSVCADIFNDPRLVLPQIGSEVRLEFRRLSCFLLRDTPEG